MACFPTTSGSNMVKVYKVSCKNRVGTEPKPALGFWASAFSAHQVALKAPSALRSATGARDRWPVPWRDFSKTRRSRNLGDELKEKKLIEFDHMEMDT